MHSRLKMISRVGLVGAVIAGLTGGARAKAPIKTVEPPENTLWGVHIKETYQDILRKYGQPDELQAGGPYYPISAELAARGVSGNVIPAGAGGSSGSSSGSSMSGGMPSMSGMGGSRPTGLTGAFGGSGSSGSGMGGGGASKTAFPYPRICYGTSVLPKWSKIPNQFGYPQKYIVPKCKKANSTGGGFGSMAGSGGSGNSSGYPSGSSGYPGGSGGPSPAGLLGADGSEDAGNGTPGMPGMMGSGSSMPGMMGSGMGSMPGMGSGMSSGMGSSGGGSQGPPEQTTIVEEPPQVVSTWWYHRPKLGLYFCFSFDRVGKVIQVQEFGVKGGSGTKRGITLGSSFGQMMQKYGWDNGGAHDDDNIVMGFTTRNATTGDRYKLAFQIQQQRIVGIGIALAK